MHNRAAGFASLLAVIGVSIVFGMVLGGKLNAPHVVFAAPPESGGSLTLAPASTLPGPGPNASFADIVDRAMPAVVSVTSRQEAGAEEPGGESDSPEDFWQWFFGPDDPQRQPGRLPMPRIGEGSGFIVSEDGYILTNNHVVQDADQVKIGLHDGTELTADVVGTDPSIDLALLKVQTDEALPTLPLGDSASLRVGEWVIAIGNPLNYEQTVTVGVVSAKNRRVPIGDTDRAGLVTFIQTDAAINFGNSGGPLIDSGGNVIGINTAIQRLNYAEGIGFALPIDQARNVIDQLRENGYVRRGYLGISMNLNGVNEEARQYYGLPDSNGVIIDQVTNGSPAAKAGIKPGDIIRKLDGERVHDNDDLIGRIASRRPGEKVRIDVFRGGRELDMTVTLAERPRDGVQSASRQSRPREEEVRPEESSGLGVSVENLTSRRRGELRLNEDQLGVLVTDVDFDSLAAERNVGRGMIIVDLNGDAVWDVDSWNSAIESLRPGQPVRLGVLIPDPNGLAPRAFFLRAPEN